MTADELFDLRANPKSAMDVTGWLLRDFEIEAAVQFQHDNPWLTFAEDEGFSPYDPLTNAW